jgi:hypothetical protein
VSGELFSTHQPRIRCVNECEAVRLILGQEKQIVDSTLDMEILGLGWLGEVGEASEVIIEMNMICAPS